MTESLELRPITFHPDVLARIAPELSMQRHLSLGLRPSLRSFEEFRNVEISDGGLSFASKADIDRRGNNILGSNVLKCGKTMVVTSITGGIVEENISGSRVDDESTESSNRADRLSRFAQVHPVVEVERGRVGAPTDEEMTLSQRLRDCVLHSGLIPKKALDVAVGIRSTDSEGISSILYPDEEENTISSGFKSRRKWSYVLYAKIQVFSRDGPLFEICWNSLIYALKTTQLPRAFVDERTADLKIPVSMRGRSATIRETFDIICDASKFQPLVLNEENVAFASNFAIIDVDPETELPKDEDEMQVDKGGSVLLADIQGEAEEASVFSTISIISSDAGRLKHFKVIGGGSNASMEHLKKSLNLAKLRASDLSAKSSSGDM